MVWLVHCFERSHAIQYFIWWYNRRQKKRSNTYEILFCLPVARFHTINLLLVVLFVLPRPVRYHIKSAQTFGQKNPSNSCSSLSPPLFHSHSILNAYPILQIIHPNKHRNTCVMWLRQLLPLVAIYNSSPPGPAFSPSSYSFEHSSLHNLQNLKDSLQFSILPLHLRQ